MKLYAFEPKGHGQKSFYIIADSEHEAREKVNAHVQNISPYYVSGWNTDYYTVSVAEIGEVIEAD